MPARKCLIRKRTLAVVISREQRTCVCPPADPVVTEQQPCRTHACVGHVVDSVAPDVPLYQFAVCTFLAVSESDHFNVKPYSWQENVALC